VSQEVGQAVELERESRDGRQIPRPTSPDKPASRKRERASERARVDAIPRGDFFSWARSYAISAPAETRLENFPRRGSVELMFRADATARYQSLSLFD
jgi:hypothetical protein